MHTAVAAVNPNPGDEIITTPVSDVGTVLGIIAQNAIPIFADMDPDTLNISPEDIERRITDRTRAILIVHLFGNPCDMDEIMDISRRHGIPSSRTRRRPTWPSTRVSSSAPSATSRRTRWAARR